MIRIPAISLIFAVLAAVAPAQRSMQPAEFSDAATPVAMDAWPQPIVRDSNTKDRRALLIEHGIAPSTASLLEFLRTGFDSQMLERGLPQDPILKSEVVNATIEELGVTGAEAAVPILKKLALKEPVPGVESVIRIDFEREAVSLRDDRYDTARRMFSLNAITALGLIGDPSVEDTILQVMRTETGTAFVTRGAVALGQMGSAKGLPAVVLLASNIESADSPEAFRVIYALTGRSYGYTNNTSLARRRELVKQMREWYDSEGEKVEVARVDVNRRVFNPPPEPSLDPDSLRGILRKSRDLQDFDGRLAARERLRQMGEQHLDDFKSISKDKMEDTDIRQAAMTWLAMSDPKGAESTLKGLRNDENPRVAKSAETLLGDLDRIARDKEKG